MNTIVFDVGNVLIYDFPMECNFLYNIYEEVNECEKMSYEAFFQNKNEVGLNCNQWIYAFGKRFFGEKWCDINSKAWDDVLSKWDKLCIPIEGAFEELVVYRDEYRYAICANQPTQTRIFMENHKWIDFFDVILLDDEMGISKPNMKMFEVLIQRLSEKPENIIMVGDKYENDIIPAHNAKMKTCLLGINDVFIKESLKSDWESIYYHYYYSKINISIENYKEVDYVASDMKDLFTELQKGGLKK